MHTTSVRRLLAVLVALLVFTGSVAGVASAQQEPFGATVVVAEGETYVGTLEAVAGSVVVAGTVEGDLQAVAGTVVLTDTGRVTGSVEAAAGTVTIDGAVGGSVGVASGVLAVGETATVGGDLEAGAGDVRLAGTVDGDVTVGAETFVVAGTAVVGGAVTYDAETFTLADDASVAGPVTRDTSLTVGTPVVGSDFDGFVLPPGVVAAYGLFVNAVLGAALLLVAPRFAARVTTVGTTGAVRSGGVGLLVLVGVPVALVLLLLTVVGIPISLAGLLAFALVLWVTSVYGALVLGTWLLSLGDYENRWAALLVGLFLVSLVGFVPLGGVVQFVVLLVGLGAFALAVRGEGGDDGDDSVESFGGDEAPMA
ncbi:bactofilin family protein [Halogeometricum limi]|uniref:Protein CcmA, bactofilin family n=1 Tax=Halogeometricum limi TaxID=555875 RepID=A0A1I6GNI1_9EURY|nr:polymer-forming cytoskeletal protein [Halogeometricum limi]SFR43686.1 protein CcmA, bactofilin family [Halogeometricum limi]